MASTCLRWMRWWRPSRQCHWDASIGPNHGCVCRGPSPGGSGGSTASAAAASASSRTNPARTFEGLFLALFAALAWRLSKQRRFVQAFYVASLVGLVLLSGTLESSGRYVLPAFPAFAVLGGISRFRVAFPLWLVACAGAQAVYVFLFVNWVWTG